MLFVPLKNKFEIGIIDNEKCGLSKAYVATLREVNTKSKVFILNCYIELVGGLCIARF